MYVGGAASNEADAGAILEMKQILFVPYLCFRVRGAFSMHRTACIEALVVRNRDKAMHKPRVTAQAM